MDNLTLIILYIINIIITRWLNKIAYNKTKDNVYNKCAVIPILWFIPIIPIIALLIGIALHSNENGEKSKNKVITWFLGRNW